jgi:tRNA-splicing ligase RtcB
MTVHEFPVTLRGAAAPTLMWAHEQDVEQAALQQLRNIAELPWVHGVRVMPDVHLGKGATVGSVIAMKQAVAPSAVGVDIGCGVVATKTSLKVEDLERLPALRAAIEGAIPLGHEGHDTPVNVRRYGLDRGWDKFWGAYRDLTPYVRGIESKAQSQIGTLGRGNHFIEVCTDADGNVWLTLHSGSRNIGKMLADYHISVAKGLSHNEGIADADMAVFLSGTAQMDAYRHDLMWAQEYALRSRAIMMALVKRAVVEHYGDSKKVTFEPDINVHHNYVSEEVIDGESMLVTRKGAIRATKGELALIPGSMATGSYVVRGLGNPKSFFSASHGAGRVLSRNKAKEKFRGDDDGQAEIKRQLGNIESRRDAGILDELPEAYKDVHAVIRAQSELVEVEAFLETRLCVKG